MTKILLIASEINRNDVGEAWVGYQWAAGLGDRHGVTLLTHGVEKHPSAAEQLPNVEVHEWLEPKVLDVIPRLNSMLKPGYLGFYAWARRWIKARLRAGEAWDVVHQATPVAMRYPCPATGLELPVVIGPVGGSLPSLAGFETTDPWFTKLRALDPLRLRADPWLRRTYEQADCVLGIAPYVAELLKPLAIRHFEVMSETALASLPDPIERADRTGVVRLLYVGRLVRTKGARDVIRALALVDPSLPVALDIVGDGPDRATCEQLVTELGLSDRVHLHGWRSKLEVANFYRAADIFVFPSFREAGGNVAPEAMSYSLPLIVANRGGPGAATTDECAIRIDVSSPDKLVRDIAQAITSLATDRDRRLKMGAEAYKHVQRTALWHAKLDAIDAVYDRAIFSSANRYWGSRQPCRY